MSDGLNIPLDRFPSEATARMADIEGNADDGWPELVEIGFGLSPVEKFDSRLIPASLGR